MRLVLAFAHRQPLFRAEVITADDFPDEARQAGVRAVPTLLLPGGVRFAGNVPAAVLAERLLEVQPGSGPGKGDPV